MWTTARRSALPLLLVATGLAAPDRTLAADRCQHQSPRALTLDLKGADRVSITLRSHDLKLRGTAPGTGGAVRGRACASSAELLEGLTVTQRRDGTTLLIDIGRDEGVNPGGTWGRDRYASLDLGIAFPNTLPVTLDVGSGDAEVDGVASLSAKVGSGDLDVRSVAGRVQATLGSGDVDASDIGALRVDSIGSGDLKAMRVRGDAEIGSVGSGDAELRDVGGSVEVGSIGSGDLTINGVAGDLRVRRAGSGDISQSGVRGRVDVPRTDD